MQESYEKIIYQIKSVLMSSGGELETACIRWIQAKIRTEKAACIEVIDIGYDCSTFGKATNDKIDTAAFETIQDFLDYPTGQSTPTFVSGAGMSAQTYDEPFTEFIREYIWDWLTRQGYDPIIRDKDGFVDDDFADFLCDSDASEYAFSHHMADKPFPNIQAVSC